MALVRQYDLLPVGECLACEKSIDDCEDFKPLGNGKFICSDCDDKIEAEVRAIVPYWFEHPLVDGEPAQEPVFLMPEPKLPAAQAVVVSRVPLFEALTEAEQMKWIMIGQSGRGESYDTQMLAQYSKWMKEKAA